MMWLGLAIMAVSESATLARIEPFWSWNMPIAWTGFILFADGLQKTFLALAAINTTAIIPSFLRGRGSQSNREAGTDSASGVN